MHIYRAKHLSVKRCNSTAALITRLFRGATAVYYHTFLSVSPIVHMLRELSSCRLKLIMPNYFRVVGEGGSLALCRDEIALGYLVVVANCCNPTVTLIRNSPETQFLSGEEIPETADLGLANLEFFYLE